MVFKRGDIDVPLHLSRVESLLETTEVRRVQNQRQLQSLGNLSEMEALYDRLAD